MHNKPPSHTCLEQLPARPFSRLASAGVLALIASPTVAAQEPQGGSMSDLLLLGSVVIFLLLVATIIMLQRSRLKYKSAELSLEHSRQQLEQRVVERTDKLRTINARLYEALNQHEATERLLRETQDHLHSIINSMPSAIVGITPQRMVTHWNTSAEQATSVSVAQALGRPLEEVFSDMAVPTRVIDQAINQGKAQVCENIQQGEGSDRRHSNITVYPLKSGDRVTGAVIRIDDVTQRIQLESMMIQNDKMMSMGELAAGMAHEINNPLSAVIQSSQNIQRRLSEELASNEEAARAQGITVAAISHYMEARGILKFVANIREAGERAAAIVGNMLEFSRYSTRQHTPTDLKALIDHSLELATSSFQLENSHFNQIEILRHYPMDESPSDQGPPDESSSDQSPSDQSPDRTMPKVMCASVEIKQVMLNILRNAAQAATDHHRDGGPPARIELSLKAEQGYAVIEVADSGAGMNEAVQRHIFEPFFTTKDVGKGTGLGLSVSYFIITEHHDGSIEVFSTPDEGTRFVIKLPL